MHRSLRLVLAGVAAVGCLLLGASGAWAADTPAFTYSHAIVDRHHGSLVVPYRVTGLTCAPGEKLFLTSERYSGLSLSGAGGETIAVTPDPASGGLAPIHVKPSS